MVRMSMKDVVVGNREAELAACFLNTTGVGVRLRASNVHTTLPAFVFKALADPSRRRLLDRLNGRNGESLRQLCDAWIWRGSR